MVIAAIVIFRILSDERRFQTPLNGSGEATNSTYFECIQPVAPDWLIFSHSPVRSITFNFVFGARTVIIWQVILGHDLIFKLIFVITKSVLIVCAKIAPAEQKIMVIKKSTIETTAVGFIFYCSIFCLNNHNAHKFLKYFCWPIDD